MGVIPLLRAKEVIEETRKRPLHRLSIIPLLIGFKTNECLPFDKEVRADVGEKGGDPLTPIMKASPTHCRLAPS